MLVSSICTRFELCTRKYIDVNYHPTRANHISRESSAMQSINGVENLTVLQWSIV